MLAQRYARRVSERHHRSPGRSARAWLVAVALVLALVAASAPPLHAATLGNGGALNRLTEEPPETTSTAKTATSSASSEKSGSNTQKVILLATVAAVALLVGIAFVIIRDARRMAPAGEVDLELSERSAEHDAAVRLRKRRAKAKAARQQRRRNR